MHYRPYSFNVDPNIPTITTNIPEFNNIIGQYLDFSKLDMLRLNRMYNCCKCCETYDRECYLFVLTQLWQQCRKMQTTRFKNKLITSLFLSS